MEKPRNIYKGNRYVPKIMGEWDKLKNYEGLSIVLNDGNSYTSKKGVPVGIDLTNETYWSSTGNYNAQIENYRRDVREVQTNLTVLEQETTAQLAQITTHPLQYGAMGDGLNNDTQAFIEAINHSENGYVVDLQGKNYLIDGVEINKKIILKNGTITLTDSSTISAISVSNLGSGTTLENLEIYVEKGNESYSSGIFLNGTSDVTVKNCYVNGSRSMVDGDFHACIAIHESNNVLIDGCLTENSHRENIFSVDSTDVIISNNMTRNSGYSGVASNNGERIIVMGNTSIGGNASSFSINTKDATVIGNQAKESKQFNGFTIGHDTNDMGGCVVADNIVHESVGVGISIAGFDNITVTGNTILNCGDAGINMVNVKSNAKANVTGNTIRNTVKGIRVFNYTTEIDLVVSGNMIENITEMGVELITGGTINVVGNSIIGAKVGVKANGRATKSLGIATTIEELIITDNFIKEIQDQVVLFSNGNDLIFTGNTLKNVNTSQSTKQHLIYIASSTGDITTTLSVKTPMPNVALSNNTIIGLAPKSFFVYIDQSDYDTTDKTLTILNNQLTTFAPNRVYSSNTFTETHIKWNKIGVDKVGLYTTIEADTTTTTINNSNITGVEPPMMVPRNAQFYDIKPFVSTLRNGMIELTHTAPSTDIGINIVF